MSTAWKLVVGILLAVLLVGILFATVKYLIGFAVLALLIVGGLALLGRWLFGRDQRPISARPLNSRRSEQAAERELQRLERRLREP